MNKQRRNEITNLKYKKRIQRFAASCSIYVNREGKYVYSPKAVDIIKDRGQLIYKTSATPCSCWMCSGEGKYKRYEQKKETQRIIREALNR
jgi:hypothetical protein